jgi:hypothetical protein
VKPAAGATFALSRWQAEGVTQSDASEVTGGPVMSSEMEEAARARRLAGRRAWRWQTSAEIALELAILPGRRWEASRGAARSLMAFIDPTPAISEAVFAIWDLARDDPPPGRDRVYSVSGDAGQIVVAHAEDASVVARSGGPFLVMTDALGKMAWRVEADEVWKNDLAEIFRELWEVAHGRPAVDESQIPPMPRLPWHADPEPG